MKFNFRTPTLRDDQLSLAFSFSCDRCFRSAHFPPPNCKDCRFRRLKRTKPATCRPVGWKHQDCVCGRYWRYMAIGEPFYLSRGSSSSSTSTLFLRISDQSGDENPNGGTNLALDLDSTTHFVVTLDSSPYMRSSPQELLSEASIHECPPESSSPFLSSAGSSPYFPAILLSESGCSSGRSSSNTDNSDRDISGTGILEESAVFSPVLYNLWFPIKNLISGSQDSRDEFSRCLYDRLLVVKRERERAETSINSQDGNAESASFYEDAPFFSGQVSPQANSLGCSGFSRTSSADETDVETPFFASPPRSDNITPPKYRKRPRESDADESLCNDALQVDKENQNYEQTPYRLIWGARSFEAYQNRRSQKEDWEYDAPPLKRQRTYTYPHRQEYASKPASLRRALSLKSDCDSERTQDSASPYSDQELTPTEPATPIASNRGSEDGSFLAYGVPIIAPPLNHVAALPISMETVAKNRIHRFLEKELVTRGTDGLGIPYRQAGDDILLPQSDMWENLLAIGQSYREDVIEWLLHVLPAELNGHGSTPASSFSSTSSQSSTSSCRVDLYDELSSSPETRFHAASIFLRFFYRVMSEASNLVQVAFRDGRPCLSRIKNDADNRSASFIAEEGKELIIWDVAVASLALSVKLHRDVLQPLSPIFAQEYLDLAHHRISFDDLETAHRDILSALSYDLGLTPQPLLDNLWLGLPSLRQLFDYEGGWNHVMRETWLQLFDAISEPDILQFPLSSITVACLVEGIITALVHNHDYRSTWRKSVMKRKQSGRGRDPTAKKKRALRKAGEAVEGVIHDIQAVTGVTDARLLECRSWLMCIRKVPSSD